MRLPDLLRRPAAVAGACFALAPSGCGGAPANLAAGPAALARRADRAMLLFARCMRAHGIEMADPVTRAGHGVSINLPERGPATTAAYRVCGSLLQPLVKAKQAHQKVIPDSERLGLVHYADCMREHNISMLDPTPDGELNLGNVPGVHTDFGRYSPQFLVADRVCRRLLPAGVRDNGTGP